MEIQKPPARKKSSARSWTEFLSRFKDSLRRWLKPPRRLRFTRFGTYVVLITLGIGLGAMNTGNNLIYLVFGMMLGFITASGVISEMSLRGLQVDWIIPTELFAGAPSTLRLILKNSKESLPSIGLKVETPFENGFFLYVPPKSHAALDIPFTPKTRGKFTISKIKIETKFPFGFFRKWLIKEGGQTPSFIVYPKIDLHQNLKIPETHAEKNRTTRQKGWGDTFWQIRNFFEGDNPRQISWKVSAKQARLMVRETERETDKMILLIMEPPSLWRALSAGELEAALSFAATLVWKMFQGGFAVGFFSEDFVLRPTTNRKNLAPILEFLALFDPCADRISNASAPFFPEAQPILALWKANRK